MKKSMVLFDTNILVYSQDIDDHRYTFCRSLVKQSEQGKISGVVAVQNLIEFTAVMLNIAKIRGKTETKGIVRSLRSFKSGIFSIIYPSEKALILYGELLEKYYTTSYRVYDIFLAATMLGNGISQIYTYNVDDFSLFPQIKAIHPEKINL